MQRRNADRSNTSLSKAQYFCSPLLLTILVYCDGHHGRTAQEAIVLYLLLWIHGCWRASSTASSFLIGTRAAQEGFGNGGDSNYETGQGKSLGKQDGRRRAARTSERPFRPFWWSAATAGPLLVVCRALKMNKWW